MTHFKVMVRLGMDSGIPEDAAINTWHCDAVALAEGYKDFVDDLEAFYQAIDGLLSSAIDPANITATVYNMLDPEPRAPVWTKTFSGITTATVAWPPEIAVCLSFQGERVSGQSQARRRGRVYLGPVQDLKTSSTDPHISPGAISTITGAASTLLAASDGNADYTWSIYSPTDDALVDVHDGWVDNAPDIQRRRGFVATTRTVWS